MPSQIHIVFVASFLALVAGLRAAPPTARAPLVALAPASLHQEDKVAGPRITEAASLAELVQIALQVDPASPVHEFVERGAIDNLLREQTLSLADGASAVRVGRLLHADWLLRLRLRADDPARPRVEAEVVDSLRADLLARAESPLPQAPGLKSLERPPEALVRLATAASSRALSEALARSAALADRSTLAPLVLINRSGTERLAPLAPRFLAALRADHPSTHALGYHAPDEAFAESALFLAGLTDLAPEAWARVADAYLWGEFAESETYVGPVADTPVSLTLQLWRESETPRTLEFSGTLGALDELARRGAAGVLDAAAGAKLVPTPELRRAAAARLVATASPLAEGPDTRFLTDGETGRARLARETRHIQLLAKDDTATAEESRRSLAAILRAELVAP